jgi:hypothetical protein
MVSIVANVPITAVEGHYQFIHACIKFIKLKMVQDSVHYDDLPSA